MFDCDHVVEGETDEEVMKRGAEYAIKDYGMKEEDNHPGGQRKSKRTYLYFLT
jgi:hypothetical protein